MACFPPCSTWCQCIDGVCRPAPLNLNAIRFKVSGDTRFLQAANGGGGLLVAANVSAPSQAETFLLVPPTATPLTSGGQLALDVCASGWGPSGSRVRVDHNVKLIPPKSKKGTTLVTYEVGGPMARVLVRGPFSAGYPAYPGDDPAERIFDLVKVQGGVPAPAGTPIADGDEVAIRINSNYGQTFWFRVTGGGSGAEVHGDGAFGSPGTIFRIELNEVRLGEGWRPREVKCQSCAGVTAVVTNSESGNPVAGATVVAQVPGHPYSGVSGPDGRAILRDAEGRTCVPAGPVSIVTTHPRHKTSTTTVTVPDAGRIDVPIVLDCTHVSGRIVDSAGSPVPGATVILRDANRHPILDPDGVPYTTTTDGQGRFDFRCVPHVWVQVWTLADPMQLQHTKDVPPDGWVNITIVIQTSCAKLVGRVFDATTGAGIVGATVTESGGRQTTTGENGQFTFDCIRPSGQNTLYASAPGYGLGIKDAVVPVTGTSNPVDIPLQPVAAEAFELRLDWGMQPADLDAHLSGPDGAGGRFHLFFGNLSAPPVPYVALSVDDTSSLGPEVVTIRRTAPGGPFVAGTYRVWVHNFSGLHDPGARFAGSSAAVNVSSVDQAGGLQLLGRFDVVNAAGPEDALWHVIDLDIDAAGSVIRTAVQAYAPGDHTTEL